MANTLSELLSRELASGAWSDCLPVAVYTCDLDGRIVQYNRRAAEIWGRSPVIGDSDQRFCGAFRLFQLDGSELPHAATPMADVLRTGKPMRDQTVVIERPDGRRLTVLVNIDPLHSDDGTLLGAVNCFQDVSELQQARDELVEKEHHLQALLEAMPAAIYTTDAAGRLTFFNRAAVELAGRKPELGEDRWCVTWRLYWPDGSPMAHDECPMATSLVERRALSGHEAVAERPDGTRVPFLAYPTPLFDDNGKLVGAVNMLIDITERKKAESSQRLMVNELNHRVKNTLSIVQSIARQTIRRASSPAQFVERLSGRIDALAAAHTILTRETWSGAALKELIETQLALDENEASRVTLNGPVVTLGAQTSLHMALVLHELGANARKYGSLSVPEGRLDVTWDVESQPRHGLHLIWRENGGPSVSAPASRGFGSALIERSLQAEGGAATIIYDSTGVTCDIRLALNDQTTPNTTAQSRTEKPALNAVPKPAHSELKGRRVLVVEDEPFLAMDLEAMLDDAGCKVIGPALDYDTAIGLARQADIDLAVLDANLGGRPVDEIAAELTRRQVPFCFASGYGREGLPAAFRNAPLISKPYGEQHLLNELEKLLIPDERVTRINSRHADAD